MFSFVVKLIIAEFVVMLDIVILDIIGIVTSNVIVSVTGLDSFVQLPNESLNQA